MIYLILASLIADLVALSFGISLIFRKKSVEIFAIYATPFAAGALLAAAFTDLLPETAELGSYENGLLAALAGILGFFFLERFVHWVHHHRDENEAHEDKDATIPLIIFGNMIHRAIDGVSIAAGFLTSTKLGFVITTAIVIHEIPHTVGDFGLLIYKGLSRSKVVMINVAVALFTTFVAVFVYALGGSFHLPLDILLGITAGFFIYIAVSDIIPDIHISEDRRFIGMQSILLILGVVTVTLMIQLVHYFFGEI